MLQITVDLGKLTEWLALFVNTIVLVSGLVVLLYTRRNVVAVLRQLRSQSQHQIIEAHKTLYMPIVQDNDLARTVFGENWKTAQGGILISMVINHASRIYADYETGITDAERLPGFADDVGGLFQTEAIAARWQTVKRYHRPQFVAFVDASVAKWIANPSVDPVFVAVPADGSSPAAPPLPVSRLTSLRKWLQRGPIGSGG